MEQTDGALRVNGASAGLPASGFRTQFSGANPPEQLAAVFSALSRYTGDSLVITIAQAEKIVMTVARYKDHLHLARGVVNYLRNRGTLLQRDAGGLIWNDPSRPLTRTEIAALTGGARSVHAQKAPVPDVETCRAFLLSLGGARGSAIRVTVAWLIRRLEREYRLGSFAAFELLDRLFDADAVVLDTEDKGMVRVSSPHVASDATPVTTEPTGTTKHRYRITSREQGLLVEIIGETQVEGIFARARRTLGSANAAYNFYDIVVRRAKILVSERRGIGSKLSVHTVDHAAFDRAEFTVDDTLPRARHEGPAIAQATKPVPVLRPKAAKRPKLVRKAARVSDSPGAILARVEAELASLQTEEENDVRIERTVAQSRAALEKRLGKLEGQIAEVRDQLETLSDTHSVIGGNRKGREARRAKLDEIRKLARELLSVTGES